MFHFFCAQFVGQQYGMERAMLYANRRRSSSPSHAVFKMKHAAARHENVMASIRLTGEQVIPHFAS